MAIVFIAFLCLDYVMNGEKFLEGIADETDMQAYGQVRPLDNLLQSLVLGSMHAVHSPKTIDPTVANEAAFASMYAWKGVNYARKQQEIALTNSIRAQNIQIIQDKFTARPKIQDITATFDSSEMLSKGTSSAIELLDHSGMLIAAKLLGEIPLKIASNSAKIAASKTSIPKIVTDILASSRRSIAQEYSSIGSTITVERTRVNHLSEPIAIKSDIRSWTKLNHVPDFFKGHEEWDEALHWMCARLSELDVFTALNEWCIKNKLPYAAIMSPRALDSRQNTSQKSLNCDVILVGFESNSIIPVQVKNTIQFYGARKYDENVIMLSPSSLGLIETKYTTVIDSTGHVHTGTKSVTSYGEIWCSFISANNPNKKGKQSKKKSLPTEAAFAFFDTNIMPHIKADASLPKIDYSHVLEP